MTQRILDPGEIQAGAAGGAPLIRLPDTENLFRQRAARLRQLAAGHALSDYLQFIAAVSDAQHEMLKTAPGFRLPAVSLLEQARTHGMPPLNAIDHARDPAWRTTMRRLLKNLESRIEIGRAHV